MMPVPDAGAAAQAAELTWHRLPELPPHREPTQQVVNRGRYRKITVLPTDAVLVRTAKLEPEGVRATFHHRRKVFVGAESRHTIPDVVEWAFAPSPAP